ncbi:deoxyribonuclease IV [Marinisporobacter balticus]|uniref:Probable endonuclease 4 n=1 Tax=Marinisporobacter balticus TaxID=2018667 RepID=A0A4R2KS62_9FIRM|nr:deoxyribonuclease IV [Marinisporobacter balticus]TCO73829.1 endonuclease IV [Marinisporobacter balticus]
MLNIGCHLSISKGFYKATQEALSINANTFQFFTRNPRGRKAKDLDLEDMRKSKVLMEKNNFAPILGHAPYTMNLCSAKPDIREFAKNILKDDLERLRQIPNSLYNFHPGSHTGQGVEKGIEQIINALNEIITEDIDTWILLETMSGKGTEVGKSLEELKQIIDGVKYNKIGLCLDSCHLYSSGYDIVNNLDGVIAEIDRRIGINKIKAFHLNDTKHEISSNKDRHEIIGEGIIGLDAIINIINHPKLLHIPFILETPNDVKGHGEEIKVLKHKQNVSKQYEKNV